MIPEVRDIVDNTMRKVGDLRLRKVTKKVLVDTELLFVSYDFRWELPRSPSTAASTAA